MASRRMKILALALGALTLPGLMPSRLAAQINPRLVAVVRLAQGA